jgi:hypothetical protein
MRSWRCTSIVFVVVVLITAACGGGTPPGGGAPAADGGSAQSPAQSPTDAPSGSSAQSPTQAPANPPPAAQPAKAAGGGTQNVINLSAKDQPGSSIKSEVTDSIKVGRKVDTSKPEIGDLLWTMPPDTPKIYFGFTAKNTEERAFTQKLFVNGSEVSLQDLRDVPVPPVPPGKKLFVAHGLAVKPGNSFPVGKYKIDVYSKSDGKLIQSTDWNIKEEKQPAAAIWNISSLLLVAEAGLLWGNDRAYDPAPIDPSIFTVIDVPDEIIAEDFEYYDAKDLEQAYQDLATVDQVYESFPAEVQQAVEVQTDLDNALQCEQAGGTYENFNDLCYVNANPAQACLDVGGTYQNQNDGCFFFPSDEIPLSKDIQQAIEVQSDQDNASQCELAGGTYDAPADLCYMNEESAAVPSDEATPDATDTSSDTTDTSSDATDTSSDTTDASADTSTDTSESPTDTSADAATDTTDTSESPTDTSVPQPSAPVPTGNTAYGSDVTFSWDAVPDSTDVTYTIEILDAANNWVTTIADISDTSVIVPLDGYGCSFSWAVMAIQNGVEGPWSALISFDICS